MSESVYIETSIFGHLTARTTTNPILVGNIQITREWWRSRRASFELYTSQAVINEVGRGDREMANQRLQLLQGIPLVELNQEIRNLAEQFLKHSNLPPKADVDAIHIAAATIYSWPGLFVIPNLKIIATVTRFFLAQALRPKKLHEFL
jgi:hypothetical protein